MPRDLVVQAWMKGFEAGSKLLSWSHNPFKDGGELHEAWYDGWCNGHEPD
jgi:ribosome modulation factor